MSEIIIVDDEEHILKGLAKIVHHVAPQHHIAALFTSSIEAYQYIKQAPVDILLTDIRMPEMDGLQLAKKARTYNKQLHCIILSGYSEFAYARRAIQLGAVDYLLKPVEEDQLMLALNKIVELPAHEQFRPLTLSRETQYIKTSIETNYAQFDLDRCAASFDKTKEYLCKLFKKETGFTPYDYLKNVRIKRAMDLLRSVNRYKVYEVGEMVGLSNPVYFSKQFKEAAGVTPKEFQTKFSFAPNSLTDDEVSSG